jgi:hypothetical protein
VSHEYSGLIPLATVHSYTEQEGALWWCLSRTSFYSFRSFAYSCNTMVYTGKPSRGCGMCKSRRIKVSTQYYNVVAQSYKRAPNPVGWSHPPNLCPVSLLTCRSVMKRDRHVATAENQGASVLDSKTNSIWCSGMRTKQWLVRRRRLDRHRLGVVREDHDHLLLHICKLRFF